MTTISGPAPAGLATELTHLVAGFFDGPPPVGVRAWDGSVAGPRDAPALVLRTPRALRRVLRHPDGLALAEAYVTGEIDVDGDLAEGLRRVRAAAHGVSPGTLLAMLPGAVRTAVRTALRADVAGSPPAPARPRAGHRWRPAAGHRDRSAPVVPHDLPNEFYALVLDPQLVHSCGYWAAGAPDHGLEDAQTDKLDLVCRKLALRPGQRLLDVGCGWGALSVHAAKHYGAEVTGITPAPAQAAAARARVAAAGLAGRVRIRLQDHRELADPGYDAVAVLEAGEHVGDRDYPRFAATLQRMAVPGGRVLVQQVSRSAGGRPGLAIESLRPDLPLPLHLRPVGETVAALERAGLELRDVHALREHYVRTLAAWHGSFEQRYDEVVGLVGEETARRWRLYLVGGRLAFEEGRLGVHQILAVRPRDDGTSGMPTLRGA